MAAWQRKLPSVRKRKQTGLGLERVCQGFVSQEGRLPQKGPLLQSCFDLLRFPTEDGNCSHSVSMPKVHTPPRRAMYPQNKPASSGHVRLWPFPTMKLS